MTDCLVRAVDTISGSLIDFAPAGRLCYSSVGQALNACAFGLPSVVKAKAIVAAGAAPYPLTSVGEVILRVTEIEALVAALPPGERFSASTALLSLRDPDVEYVAAWKRDWYRPFLSANQYAIARAVGAAFSDGFYIARMFDSSALDLLGARPSEPRFWRPSYFHLRNAIADVVDDPILCARVALELSQ